MNTNPFIEAREKLPSAITTLPRPAEEVKKWVELTKGQASGAVKSVLEAIQEASA